jgi:transcription elongation factor Elf1
MTNSMDKDTLFDCSRCGTQYKVVRVEAPAAPDHQAIACLDCGAPLDAREGTFALKYFRMKRSQTKRRLD